MFYENEPKYTALSLSVNIFMVHAILRITLASAGGRVPHETAAESVPRECPLTRSASVAHFNMWIPHLSNDHFVAQHAKWPPVNSRRVLLSLDNLTSNGDAHCNNLQHLHCVIIVCTHVMKHMYVVFKWEVIVTLCKQLTKALEPKRPANVHVRTLVLWMYFAGKCESTV